MNQQSNGALAPKTHGPPYRALAEARFEVVPIKGVDEQARYLPRGTKVTVTCSPTRGIENTLRVAEALAGQGLRLVPHISARLVENEAHLEAILRRVSDLGLREIFVIGGDVPRPAGPFAGALDLLRAMADLGHDLDQIGVAAYPEGHPLIEDGTLRRALRDKEPYATYMVTQISFDPGTIARWLAGIREEGIALPAYIGLPGVVNMRKLLRVSMKIGVGDSLRFLSKQANLVGGLLGGGYHPDRLLEGLAPYLDDRRYTIRGLHLNTFNQVEDTENWRQRMLKAAGHA